MSDNSAEAAERGDLDPVAAIWHEGWHDAHACIVPAAAETLMIALAMIVRGELSQRTTKVPLTEKNDAIQAFFEALTPLTEPEYGWSPTPLTRMRTLESFRDRLGAAVMATGGRYAARQQQLRTPNELIDGPHVHGHHLSILNVCDLRER